MIGRLTGRQGCVLIDRQCKSVERSNGLQACVSEVRKGLVPLDPRCKNQAEFPHQSAVYSVTRPGGFYIHYHSTSIAWIWLQGIALLGPSI